ncbi:lrr receptor-like serine threonine-protein kinase [Hordeum vulgare]|nr:lrr receptor-like serine threonine-protein kinase [Hordeum vulgare]
MRNALELGGRWHYGKGGCPPVPSPSSQQGSLSGPWVFVPARKLAGGLRFLSQQGRLAEVLCLEDDGWGKKRKLTFTGFDPYDPEYSDDEEYEYDSGEDVYKGNFKSFKAKEVEKIKAKGVASFFNRKIKKWRCPYCTTKPKPKDGRFNHLVSHAEDVAIRGEDYMISGQHAALAKALTPV